MAEWAPVHTRRWAEEPQGSIEPLPKPSTSPALLRSLQAVAGTSWAASSDAPAWHSAPRQTRAADAPAAPETRAASASPASASPASASPASASPTQRRQASDRVLVDAMADALDSQILQYFHHQPWQPDSRRHQAPAYVRGWLEAGVPSMPGVQTDRYDPALLSASADGTSSGLRRPRALGQSDMAAIRPRADQATGSSPEHLAWRSQLVLDGTESASAAMLARWGAGPNRPMPPRTPRAPAPLGTSQGSPSAPIPGAHAAIDPAKLAASDAYAAFIYGLPELPAALPSMAAAPEFQPAALDEPLNAPAYSPRARSERPAGWLRAEAEAWMGRRQEPAALPAPPSPASPPAAAPSMPPGASSADTDMAEVAKLQQREAALMPAYHGHVYDAVPVTAERRQMFMDEAYQGKLPQGHAASNARASSKRLSTLKPSEIAHHMSSIDTELRRSTVWRPVQQPSTEQVTAIGVSPAEKTFKLPEAPPAPELPPPPAEPRPPTQVPYAPVPPPAARAPATDSDDTASTDTMTGSDADSAPEPAADDGLGDVGDSIVPPVPAAATAAAASPPCSPAARTRSSRTASMDSMGSDLVSARFSTRYTAQQDRAARSLQRIVRGHIARAKISRSEYHRLRREYREPTASNLARMFDWMDKDADGYIRPADLTRAAKGRRSIYAGEGAERTLNALASSSTTRMSITGAAAVRRTANVQRLHDSYADSLRLQSPILGMNTTPLLTLFQHSDTSSSGQLNKAQFLAGFQRASVPAFCEWMSRVLTTMHMSSKDEAVQDVMQKMRRDIAASQTAERSTARRLRAQLSTLYQEMDAHNTGRVLPRQFQSVLSKGDRTVPLSVNLRDQLALYRRLDADGDMELTHEEFVGHLVSEQPAEFMEWLRAWQDMHSARGRSYSVQSMHDAFASDEEHSDCGALSSGSHAHSETDSEGEELSSVAPGSGRASPAGKAGPITMSKTMRRSILQTFHKPTTLAPLRETELESSDGEDLGAPASQPQRRSAPVPAAPKRAPAPPARP